MATFSCIRSLLLMAPFAAAMGAQAISPTKADIAFVDQAIIGGLYEIRYAEIAMHRNLTPQEQAFAQEVITDHLRLNKELADLARMKSIATPDALPADGQERVLALSKVDDREFNESFLKIMISCHKDAVSLFEGEQSSSRGSRSQAIGRAGAAASEGASRCGQAAWRPATDAVGSRAGGVRWSAGERIPPTVADRGAGLPGCDQNSHFRPP